MQAQRDGGESFGEGGQHRGQPLRRQHDVDCQVDLGLQPVDALGECPRLGQHHPAGRGQPGLAGAPPLEQIDAELGFQVGYAVADDGDGTVEPARRRPEAAGIDDRQENAELL